MDRITDYRVVFGIEPTEDDDASLTIEAGVKELIAEGWEPLGGVALAFGVRPGGDRWTTFYQAMVKRG